MNHLRNCGRQVEGSDACFCRALAVHEAGHAVVALVLGLRIDSIEIAAPGSWEDGAGAVRFRERGDVRDLLTILAGPAAERLACGEIDPGAAAPDLAEVRVHVDGPALRALMVVTEILLAAHWPAVELLAAELAPRPQLSESDARKLLRPLLHPTTALAQWHPIPPPWSLER